MINWILVQTSFFPRSHFSIYYVVVTIHTLFRLNVGHIGFDMNFWQVIMTDLMGLFFQFFEGVMTGSFLGLY